MFRIAVALSILAAPSLSSAAPKEACVGYAVIKNYDAMSKRGPDFLIYALTGQMAPISVYVGCCSQVSSDSRRKFGRVPGGIVWRTFEDDRFTGYLIRKVKKHKKGEWVTDYHFFGSGFSDDKRDRKFFANVSFKGKDAEKCASRLP